MRSGPRHRVVQPPAVIVPPESADRPPARAPPSAGTAARDSRARTDPTRPAKSPIRASRRSAESLQPFSRLRGDDDTPTFTHVKLTAQANLADRTWRLRRAPVGRSHPVAVGEPRAFEPSPSFAPRVMPASVTPRRVVFDVRSDPYRAGAT